jgi:NADH-quinone oxidoreductase subunit C
MTFDDVKNHLTSKYSGMMTLAESIREPLAVVKPTDLKSFAQAIHDDEKLKFDFLNSVAASDMGDRFEIFYSVSSVPYQTRLDFKVVIDRDNPAVDTIQAVWPSANWYERELWELYGIKVNGHEQLGTFLLPEDWDLGFPMRRDWKGPDDFIRFPEPEL